MRRHEFNSSNYPTKLINALSIQCFLTEFIYPISSEENQQIRVLIETTKEEFVTKSFLIGKQSNHFTLPKSERTRMALRYEPPKNLKIYLLPTSKILKMR